MSDTILSQYPTLMTDEEVAEVLRITKTTIRNNLKFGPPKRRHGLESGDLRLIQKVIVGGQRRWLRDSLEAFIKQEE